MMRRGKFGAPSPNLMAQVEVQRVLTLLKARARDVLDLDVASVS
jgi:hypothetical protein